jgi:hypothetical protein
MLLMIIGGISEQTDWMGGDGVLGPVNDWRTQYFTGDSVTAATEGQVSLVATQWDYSASGWAKHILENNSGIHCHTQGLLPGDVDGDGIVDLVAHCNDEVVWYKHSGDYLFFKNVVGPADDGGAANPCVYPCDLDGDNDMDVLVATHGIGAGWFEQQGLAWVWHELDTTVGYHRISATDVELDGDLDIIAVDNSFWQSHGDICLFRDTTGFQDFTKELAVALPDSEGWRVYAADFHGDGYPDIYSVHYNVSVFNNDSSGHFSESFHTNFWGSEDYDGAWPSDIDMDGDMDLVCGNQYHFPYGFYAFLNDGTGNDFDTTLLVEDPINSYMDGSITRDIDLDGFPDIAGAHLRVGWFRQDSLLAFTVHDIDTIDNGSCHWVYAAPLCNKCIPSIDLLITHTEAHVVYENRMLQAFANGWFESSMLQLPADSLYKLLYFGYEACVPNDSSLAFFWRTGIDSTEVANKPWSGPHPAFRIGIPCVTDSFALGMQNTRMFQYKAGFKTGDDIAVLYRVWLTYQSDIVRAEEKTNHQLSTGNWQLAIRPNPFTHNCAVEFVVGSSWFVGREPPTLDIHDLAGRVVRTFDLTNHQSPFSSEGGSASGGNQITWDGTDRHGKDVAPGIYFCKLRAGDHTMTKKMFLAR